jgi:hypothetical protein
MRKSKKDKPTNEEFVSGGDNKNQSFSIVRIILNFFTWISVTMSYLFGGNDHDKQYEINSDTSNTSSNSSSNTSSNSSSNASTKKSSNNRRSKQFSVLPDKEDLSIKHYMYSLIGHDDWIMQDIKMKRHKTNK